LSAELKDNTAHINDSIKKIMLLFLKALAVFAAGYYIVLFLYISFSRLSFPIAIDWVEGAVLVQVKQLLAGHSLYAEPGASYTALIYPPLYFYISAGLALLLGFGFMPLRLTSLLATCGCLLLIFLITRRNSASKLYGVIASGLLASTYAIVWSWFDFARVDMLYMFLILLGLYFLNRGRSADPVLAGICFSLSFFTKQSALFFVLPLLLLSSLFHRKQALALILTFAISAVAGTLLLNYTSAGWYDYYVFTLPANHKLDISPERILYLFVSMLAPLTLALGIGMLPAVLEPKSFFHDNDYRFFFTLTFAIILTCVVSALSPGSTRNAYIPAYALIAILFGMGLQRLQSAITRFSRAEIVRAVLTSLLLVLCLLQFSFLQYRTGDYLPAPQDWKRAEALIKYIAQANGDVLIPSHSYLSLYVDKRLFYHDASLWELNGSVGKKPMPVWKKIQKEIRTIVQSGEASAVYMESPRHLWLNMTCVKADVFRSNSKFVPTLYKMVCY